jgi:ssDNA-binding Zn-finger/Zn-ribbon topoisomerase 1
MNGVDYEAMIRARVKTRPVSLRENLDTKHGISLFQKLNLEKSFKVLKTYPIKNLGTSHEYIEIVECPRCKEEFPRLVRSGCFNVHIDPETCPKCNYPFNIQPKDEDINPSKR